MCYPHFLAPGGVHGDIHCQENQQGGAIAEEELPTLAVLRTALELPQGRKVHDEFDT